MAKKKVLEGTSGPIEVSLAKIHPIAVDFTSEQLNNLASKVNEIIASLDKN